MSNGCCAPSDHSPTPDDERTARIALAVIVTIGVITLGGTVYLLLL